MQPPSTEARIAAQESLTTIMHAKIEQISQDMTNSFREVKQDISQLSDKVVIGFEQAHAYIDENMARKEDIIRVESTMATKEDIRDMATKEDVSALNAKLDRILAKLSSDKE